MALLTCDADESIAVVPVVSSNASASTRPAGCAGPDETTRFPAGPGGTLCGQGRPWLMTTPASTVALDCVVTVPTTRPAFWIATVAAPCVRPTTFGIALFAGPIEMASATPVPGWTLVPLAGDWLMTRPACTLLFSSVMLPTAS